MVVTSLKDERLRRVQEALAKAELDLETAQREWRRKPAFVPHHRPLIEAVIAARQAVVDVAKDLS